MNKKNSLDLVEKAAQIQETAGVPLSTALSMVMDSECVNLPPESELD